AVEELGYVPNQAARSLVTRRHQVIVSSQVRMRRNAYPGHSGEGVNLQFRGAPGNFVVVQPYEI
ncbi:hypothetical protein, partial [Streptomyces sp. NPDC060275]|uniref:hypothetical protein n=1 Tax=Streptomyces sp. NPDC060275 TaxID=3347090 RepID=UPI0036587788